MPDPLITLTTDFGEDSPYVAAMKGAILTVNPYARLLDLSHRIPPQDLRHAAFFLAGAIPYFPPDVLHVVVVDPGVGTIRALLYVAVGGRRLLVPDNGCWTLLADRCGPVTEVRRLQEARYWRQPVSSTFHGRDILGPVAGHLSRGLDPAELGEKTDAWQRLDWPTPKPAGGGGLAGEVVFVDRFGNLITNLPAEWGFTSPSLQVSGQPLRRWVRTYGEAEEGAVVALVSSFGTVEVAVRQGSAAERLRAGVGTPVVLTGGQA